MEKSFSSLHLTYFLYIILTLSFSSISNAITVSGLSSGAFQAVQYHVAFSSTVTGVGVMAGGPYWCAKNNAATAVSLMTNPNLIDINSCVNATTFAYNSASIDNPNGIKNAAIWLFSGSKDTVVVPGVVSKTQAYYQYYGNSVTFVSNIAAEHSIVTTSFGSTCPTLSTPYVNNCSYDSIQNMWTRIIGNLNPKRSLIASNLKSFSQSTYSAPYTPAQVGLASTGYVYIPSGCASLEGEMFESEKKSGDGIRQITNFKNKAACRLHLALHGCAQNYAAVGNAFVLNAGYNEWAEANNIIVLYPQAAVVAGNPNGCFDWWGFTGSNYATKQGIQLATIKKMVNAYS